MAGPRGERSGERGRARRGLCREVPRVRGRGPGGGAGRNLPLGSGRPDSGGAGGDAPARAGPLGRRIAAMRVPRKGSGRAQPGHSAERRTGRSLPQGPRSGPAFLPGARSRCAGSSRGRTDRQALFKAEEGSCVLWGPTCCSQLLPRCWALSCSFL